MRNVRPSWINVDVDGRKSPIGAGPRARSGALSAKFLVRQEGVPTDAVSVSVVASSDGSTVTIKVIDMMTGVVVLEKAVKQ